MPACIPQRGTRATCLVYLKYRSTCLGSLRALLGKSQVLIALVFKKKNLGEPDTINPTHLALITTRFFFCFFFGGPQGIALPLDLDPRPTAVQVCVCMCACRACVCSAGV
jgi:hypothetical protein